MILHAFRRHLAKELEGIPEDAEQVVESRMVTTAALARRLLDYLAIRDLSVRSGFLADAPEYPLRTVLDRILHFRVLHQDMMTFAIPGEPDLVTLYSDYTQDLDNHLYIRLRDYREAVGRLASDDQYVAGHLFRRAVTLTNTVMRTSIEPDDRRAQSNHAEFRKWVEGMLCNAWSLLVTLADAGDVTCPELVVECYERCRGDGRDAHLQEFPAISTGQDLIENYGRLWTWAPFTSSTLEIDGREKDCMHLSAFKSEEERTRCGLVVTFDSFIAMLQEGRRQLDSR